jgi:hypothetical protein
VLAEINDHMECDSVSPFQVLAEFDAALVAAGVPSTVPSFFMDNLQTGERLRIDVWNECCQRFTSKIVHVRRFLLDGQEEESQEYARGSGTPSPPYIFVGRRCNYWRRCRWAYWGLDDSESLDDAEDWRLSYFF